jgi:hypothetical protein
MVLSAVLTDSNQLIICVSVLTLKSCAILMGGLSF